MHLSLLFLILTLSAGAQEADTKISLPVSLPTTFDLETIRELPVQDAGRIVPLDTAARRFVWSVTLREYFNGHDPVLQLLAWSLDSGTWMKQPLIKIRSGELRQELQLASDRSMFSYDELLGHRPLRDLMSRRQEGKKPDPLEKEVGKISEKLSTLRKVFRGDAIRPVPDPNEINGTWKPVSSLRRDTSPEARAVMKAWDDLGKAVKAGEAGDFDAASRAMLAAVKDLPSAYQVDPDRIAMELRSNRTNPFGLAWMVMAAGAMLALAALFMKQWWSDLVAMVVFFIGFALLTYGIAVRWKLAGTIPATNMYESLLFLSWGAGAIGILAGIASVIWLRQRLVPLTTMAIAALSLMLSDQIPPLEPYLRPIMPVLLDTYWMAIHVPVIMLSYGILGVAALLAHVQLFAMAIFPGGSRLSRSLDAVHYWYVMAGAITLLVGILTGSIWAASSWGRYWGWDPKEVWSLVAFLGYMTILHVRVDRDSVPRWAYAVGGALGLITLALVLPVMAPEGFVWVAVAVAAALAMVFFVVARGPMAVAIKSILSFWMVLMTYLGVNYILGAGMHSYGFGSGALVNNFYMVALFELGLIVIMGGIYWVRLLAGDVPAATPAADSA